MSSWDTEAFDEQDSKLAEFVLYVAEKTEEDATAGSTKLNKILYFSEVAHLRKYGTPITTGEYQRLPQGPALRRLVPIIETLQARGDATEVRRDRFGYEQTKLIAIREPNLDSFGSTEIAVIDDVIQALWGRSAKETSELSHEDAGWRSVEDGQTIPKSMAFADHPETTDTIRRRAEQLVQASD
jgi:uncharacterized phage-associated protein